jgi:hypothetical protein
MAKPIKFRKISQYGHKKVNTDWQYAKDEKELRKKLGPNCLAEIHMPSKPWYVRLWSKLFPPRVVEAKLGVTYHFHNGKLVAETF